MKESLVSLFFTLKKFNQILLAPDFLLSTNYSDFFFLDPLKNFSHGGKI